MKYPDIAVPNADRGMSFIYSSDIIYCQASGKAGTLLHLKNGKKLKVKKGLTQLITLLDREQFCRIHHGILLNLRHVASYEPESNSSIKLSNGEALVISKRKKSEFLERFIWL